MKDIKLYNVIFPIWLLLFWPPIIFLTLIGNYLIDSLVVIICFSVFKMADTKIKLKTFYKKSIVKVWLFGFLSDIIGASILFFLGMFGDSIGLSYEVSSAINYDPFRHPMATIIIIFAILISSLFIFLFNYKITFKNIILEKHLRFKVSLTIAIVTMPWTFILPTKWFYY